MDVIIGTDSLQRPLTGVGRYTYGLSKHLLVAPEIDSIKGFDFGKLHSLHERLTCLGQESATHAHGITISSSFSSLQRSLSRSVIATLVYGYFISRVTGRQLRRYSDTLFHSPNFHLPRYLDNTVVTIHDLSYLLFPEYHPLARVKWMNLMVPEAVTKASRIICVSNSTKHDLVAHLQIDPGKISVIYLGVDPVYRIRSPENVLEILNGCGLKFGEYFLCVATLEPRKNIEGLITAYMRLEPKTRAQFPLVLVGGAGWKHQKLEKLLRHCQSENLTYLGFVSQDTLSCLYSGAHCFVYPSFYEGFGLPVLEAQASGIPVITSAVSSLPEVASDEAILIDPHNVEELTSALKRAVEDRRWRERCVESGLKKASNFSWEHCVMSTIKVYQDVLSKNPKQVNNCGLD